MMNIEEGEEIAGMWLTPTIPRTRVYNSLAKRTAGGEYEWIHYPQKSDGFKKPQEVEIGRKPAARG